MVAVVLGPSGCSLLGQSPRFGETVIRDTAGGPTMAVRVLPTKQYWRKPGANMEQADDAREKCRDQLSSGGEYVELLKEREPITLASMQGKITREQENRKKEINKRRSQLYRECMANRGYEYVRRGFPVEK